MTKQRHPEFRALELVSQSFNEHNDCTVKAMVVATGKPYADCHAALKAEGRPDRRGCYFRTVGPKAAKRLGYELTEITDYTARTMITAERDRRLQSGAFVVLVSGHAAGVRNGEVIDHSAGKARRIQTVYECTAIEAPEVATLPSGSAKWQAFTKYTKADNLPLF